MAATRRTAGSRADQIALAIAGASATAPIAVSLIRVLRDGWYPIGDNAYFSLRARDVLTAHHPLLGTWTSASLSVGQDMNNPGPLHWDLLALPAKIAPVAGIAVGTAVLNVVCIVAMAVMAHRRGGTARAVGVLAAAAALGWTMGTDLVVDPWQPHALLFPFLLFLVLVWSLVEGDLLALPVAVAVGSLLVQTHLSYAVLVPALGGLGVAAIAVRAWGTRRTAPEFWRGHRRSLVRAGFVTAIVAALAWVQPIAEQLTADDGNLGRVLRNSGGGDEPHVGPMSALRLVAALVAAPPAWLRPSFGAGYVQEGIPADAGVELLHVPSAGGSLLAFSLLTTALVLVGWRARRRDDRGAAAGALVALAALALGLATTAVLPIGPSGFGIHQVRWLWPIGILAALAVLAAAGRTRWFVPALAAVAVVLGAAALPTYHQATGPSVDVHAMPVMRAIARQLDEVSLDGPVLFAAADLRKMPLYEPYSTPMMFEMDRRGIGFVVDDPSQARQVGEARLHPERATLRMVLLQGDRTLDPPAGGRLIAHVDGLERADRAELGRLLSQLTTDLESERLALTTRGKDLAARGLLPGIEPDGSVDLGALLGPRILAAVVQEGVLDERTPGLAAIRRYAELQERWDASTLAVYVVPVDEPAQVISR